MTDETPKPLDKVRFVYSKARHHRTLHADGAWAAVTPQLEVQFALFNDLRLMPNEVTNLVTKEGGVGAEVSKDPPETDMPGHVLREVDVTVVVSRNTAKNLIDALTLMVEAIDKHVEIIKAKSSLSESEIS
jgi:hypothetical protein